MTIMSVLAAMKDALLKVGGRAIWKPYFVRNCSCEGMAQHLFNVFNPMIREATKERVFITTVEVTEDSKNSATYISDSLPTT